MPTPAHLMVIHLSKPRGMSRRSGILDHTALAANL
jgi:hypothetical protein